MGAKPRSFPPHEDLLPELRQRRDHRAERELRTSVAVDDSGSDDGHVGLGIEVRDQPIDRPAGHVVSGFSSSTSSEDDLSNAAIVCRREAEIAPTRSAGRGPSLTHERRRSIRRRVVDHQDVVRRHRARVGSAMQATSISRLEL